MRLGIVLFLISAILSANFSRLYVFAGFEMNQNYIASTLCENRDKPELNCKGSCFLSKKLAEAAEKEKKQDKENYKKAFQEAFINQSIAINFKHETLKVENAIIPQFHVILKNTTIFHPPKNV